MHREKQASLRQRLEAERRRVQESIDNLEEGGLHQSLSESIEELSAYDQHPADIGSEVFERSKDLALRDNAVIQSQKIDHALAAMDGGTYGVCERCGKEIPEARLDAAPETTLCLPCRRAMEGKGARHLRPIEEDVVQPPWGQRPGAGLANEYDGEDAWQDLAHSQEHAPSSGAGSYYGDLDMDEERGYVEAVEALPYYKGADGMFYADGRGLDDEDAPEERLVGDEGWDRLP